MISIHALLAESDNSAYGALDGASISIHALLAESDSPARITPAASRNFYPRSPCGERRHVKQTCQAKISISIHALLAESDPRRSADCNCRSISIHALLAESDHISKAGSERINQFLSTLSLRRATSKINTGGSENIFLSTLSLRRATAKVHKTVGHFCAYGTNFMGIASSC